MELLRTERIILRSWAEDDLAAYFEIYSRDEVVRWLGAHPRRAVANLDEARTRLKAWCDFHADFEAPYGLWAIALTPGTAGTTETAEVDPAGPVGTALLLPLSDDDGPTDEVEIGWHLHPHYQGQGLATESAKALLAHLPPGAPNRVLALTDLDNTASQAVAVRLGMVDQGRTERWFGETMLQYCWTRPGQ
jgi:RimJ/RimL family protein N-acetyltransferase